MTKMFKKAKPLYEQKYSQLKKECLKSGKLFSDPEFKPCDESLSYKKDGKQESVQWKRPAEIVKDPRFMVEGVGSDDLSQGSVGNCWFVAALACLTGNKQLWKKVIPAAEEQEWVTPKGKPQYAGIFRFRFWRMGEWVEVVVDDYLPTQDGQLMYIHSKQHNEFWSALLEKAYAKLFGDYESLSGGFACDALVDMTGGVGQGVTLKEAVEKPEMKRKFFSVLKKGMDNLSMMSASIRASEKSEVEAKTDVGLVKGHAYSITAVKEIKLGSGLASFFKQERLRMVRCRNPWGQSEWNGAWSDGSEEWKKVGQQQKKKLGLTFEDNGEFWMSFDDFCAHFTHLEICHMFSKSFASVFTMKKWWREGRARGAWQKPDRAGGHEGDQAIKNPQFLFDVPKDDDDVVLSLEQFDRRITVEDGEENYSIALYLMKADLNRTSRMHDKLDRIQLEPYTNRRSFFARVALTRGRYCVIPSTWDPGQEGEFMVRVYAAADTKLREVTQEVPPKVNHVLGCLCGEQPRVGLQVKVLQGRSLPKDGLMLPDPYVVLRCGRQTVRTATVKSHANPTWNERATFFTTDKHMSVIAEVYDDNVFKDRFLGTFVIKGDKRDSGENFNYALEARKTKKKGKVVGGHKLPGSIVCTVKCSSDLVTL